MWCGIEEHDQILGTNGCHNFRQTDVFAVELLLDSRRTWHDVAKWIDMDPNGILASNSQPRKKQPYVLADLFSKPMSEAEVASIDCCFTCCRCVHPALQVWLPLDSTLQQDHLKPPNTTGSFSHLSNRKIRCDKIKRWLSHGVRHIGRREHLQLAGNLHILYDIIYVKIIKITWLPTFFPYSHPAWLHFFHL